MHYPARYTLTSGIGLTCLLILLATTLASAQSPVTKDESDGKWESLKYGPYTIQYPGDWEVDTSGQMGTSFILFSPLTDPADQFRENVNLLVQDLTGYDLTLDQYVEISEDQIRTMVDNGHIISSTRIREGNPEFHKMIYSGTHDIYQLQFEQYYRVADQTAFVLTLTCETDQFGNYRKTGEAILNSFVIH